MVKVGGYIHLVNADAIEGAPMIYTGKVLHVDAPEDDDYCFVTVDFVAYAAVLEPEDFILETDSELIAAYENMVQALKRVIEHEVRLYPRKESDTK